MTKFLGIVMLVTMTMVAFAAAIFSIISPGSEKRWGLLERIGNAVNALTLRPALVAFTAILPAVLLSTASIRTDKTTHTGARRGRLLSFVIISTIVLGALAFLRSHFGGGDENQQREHSDAETASDAHDEHTTTEAPAPTADSDEAQAA